MKLSLAQRTSPARAFFVAGLLAISFLSPSETSATTIGLGTAARFSVLSLEGTRQTIGGSAMVYGDVGVGPNGSLRLESGARVGDTIYAATTATVSGGGGDVVLADMRQVIADARSAATQFAALSPTLSLSNISGSTTINRTSLDTVISLSGGITLSGTNRLTLSGGANDYFVFNIQGGLDFSGSASVVLAGGVTADHVVFNFIGAGSTLTADYGTLLQGTFLAPQRNISFANTFGSIIGGGTTLNIAPCATICPVPYCPTPIPEVSSFAPLAGVLLGAVGLHGMRRRRILPARVLK